MKKPTIKGCAHCAIGSMSDRERRRLVVWEIRGTNPLVSWSCDVHLVDTLMRHEAPVQVYPFAQDETDVEACLRHNTDLKRRIEAVRARAREEGIPPLVWQSVTREVEADDH